MSSRLGPKFRRYIAGIFWGKFPQFYSTADHPVKVPVQMAAYELGTERYMTAGGSVLDVGYGQGYGLQIMAGKAGRLAGIDVDGRAVARTQQLIAEIPGLEALRRYDGYHVPYPDKSFDLVTCVDVLEHVPDYRRLLSDMVRVSRTAVLISTPNRRPEYTRPDGKPMNRWHLREWTFAELDPILRQVEGVEIEWHFINGPWEGPHTRTREVLEDTQALTPVLLRATPAENQSGPAES